MADPPPERTAFGLLVSGLALLIFPWLLYPGNFANQPPGPAELGAWTLLAVLIYVSLLLGALLLGWGSARLLRGWEEGPGASTRPGRAALAHALREPRFRPVWIVSLVGFALFFSFFTGSLAVSLHGAFTGTSYPSGTVVFCCGGLGLTPGLVALLGPGVLLSYGPQSLALLGLSTTLFSANMVASAALWRGRSSPGEASVAGALGALGALFVNCPQCGTLLLFNALEASAAAGLIAGWVAYQAPLLLIAFPLSLGTLAYAGRALSRPPACPVPARSPGSPPREPGTP